VKHCPGFNRDAHTVPRSDFNVNRTVNDGLQKRCRPCHAAYMKDYRARCKETPPEALLARRHPSGMKRCPRCPRFGRPALRPLEDFYRSSGSSGGKYQYCKDCVREMRWESYGVVGMTVERYATMLVEQNHQCAIPSCGIRGTDKRTLDVDHDHATGEVRGLLCRNCNTILGACRESAAVLVDLIAYLSRPPAVLGQALLE
jgi:recombination endonuclease VII